MYGLFSTIATRPAIDKQRVGKQMIGLGSTPEGIQNNEIMYELLYEMVWQHEPITDQLDWVHRYVTRRYAISSIMDRLPTVYSAYDLLLATVYNCTSGQWGVTKSFIELTPSLNMNRTGFMATSIWYDNQLLQIAATQLLNATDVMLNENRDPAGIDRYLYDVIDVTKQWLSNRLIYYHAMLVNNGYKRKDLTVMKEYGSIILTLISDLDTLLATNHNYLLGRWINDARAWGNSIDAGNDLEWNARNQVTLWGPDGEIADYASKLWTGLISNYYLPRWQLFIESLTTAVQQGQDWNEAAYDTAKRQREQDWQWSREKFPLSPQGKTIAFANYVLNKYSK